MTSKKETNKLKLSLAQAQNTREEIGEEDDDDELLSDKDVERLANLWKNMRDSKKQLGSTRSWARYGSGESNNNTSNLQNTFSTPSAIAGGAVACFKLTSPQPIIERDILHSTTNDSHSPPPSNSDQQLQKHLQKKQREQEIEISQCHEKIARLLSQKASQQKEIENMTLRLESYSAQQKEVIEKSRASTSQIESCLLEKERTLVSTQNENSDLKIQVAKLLESNKFLLIDIEKLEVNLTQADETTDRNDSQQIELEQERLVVEKQMESLHNDIVRLTALLLSTSEYKNALFSCEDMSQLRYLSHSPVFLHTYGLRDNCSQNFYEDHNQSNGMINTSTQRLGRRRCSASGCTPLVTSTRSRSRGTKDQSSSVISSVSAILPERQLWAPKNALQMVAEIGERHGFEFQDQFIEELVFSLQKVLDEHLESSGKSKVTRLEKQITDLKKQLQKSFSFDEVQAKTRLLKLKTQLSNARKTQPQQHGETSFNQFSLKSQSPEYRRNRSSSKNSQQEKMIYFTDALRLFSTYESEARQLQEQTAMLEARVKSLTEASAVYDKVIYMEGAVWMSEKHLREIKKLVEYSAHLTSAMTLELLSFPSAATSAKPFIQQLTDLHTKVLDKFIAHKEFAIKQIMKVQKNASSSSNNQQQAEGKENNAKHKGEELATAIVDRSEMSFTSAVIPRKLRSTSSSSSSHHYSAKRLSPQRLHTDHSQSHQISQFTGRRDFEKQYSTETTTTAFNKNHHPAATEVKPTASNHHNHHQIAVSSSTPLQSYYSRSKQALTLSLHEDHTQEHRMLQPQS